MSLLKHGITTAAILLFFAIQPTTLEAKKKDKKLAPLIGIWIGEAYQYDVDETFQIVMKCDKESVQITYPNLKCGGKWELVKGRKKRFLLQEKIQYDPYSTCTDDGYVLLEYAEKNKWKITFFHPTKDSIQAVGGIQRIPQTLE